MTTRLAAGYLALLLLAAFGLFSNLDDRLLWGDEAETAVLAVNIMPAAHPPVRWFIASAASVDAGASHRLVRS